MYRRKREIYIEREGREKEREKERGDRGSKRVRCRREKYI